MFYRKYASVRIHLHVSVQRNVQIDEIRDKGNKGKATVTESPRKEMHPCFIKRKSNALQMRSFSRFYTVRQASSCNEIYLSAALPVKKGTRLECKRMH